MGKKGDATRKRILDTAQQLILTYGFSGMSVDMLIAHLDMTKGAFFHHFKNKNELARSLLQRFLDEGIAFFDVSLERARKYSDDPLQQLLILVRQYSEVFENLAEPYDGCLFAAYVYEYQQFDEETQAMISLEFKHSREVITQLLHQAADRYPPKQRVDLQALADSFMVIFEGAFILERALGEPGITSKQLDHYCRYIELLFARE